MALAAADLATVPRKKGCIAFLDILGFKGIWQRRTPQEVLLVLSGVRKVVAEKYKAPAPDRKWPPSSEPSVTILSDTIVIAIDSDEPHCALLMANLLYHVMMHFHEHRMFVRGALAYGEYLQDGNTFIGETIDDVASWYELADWIGVVATPKTGYILDRFDSVVVRVNGLPVTQFVKYDVPGKVTKNRLNAFNWPAYTEASLSHWDGPDKPKTRAMTEALFAEQSAFDGNVLRKYENTLDFVDYSISHFRVAASLA